MRSLQSGRTTHPVSVGDIAARVLAPARCEQKLFLAFAQFPWFREFTLRERRLLGDPAEVVARWRAAHESLAPGVITGNNGSQSARGSNGSSRP